MTLLAAASTVHDAGGGVPAPNIPSSVYPLDIRSDVLNPSSVGEGAGPLAIAFLPGADFQGGPASIRDPQHGVYFLPPDQEPPAESIPRDSRLGRLMAAILSLRAIPLPRSRDVQPGAGVLPLASGCEFQCSHPNSFRRGFALGAGVMTAFGLATITDGAGSSLAVLGVSGAVVLASALSDKFLSSRAAASPRLSNSSRAHTPALDTCRANAAFSFPPNIAGSLAKVSGFVRYVLGIPSLHLQRPHNGEGVVGNARQVGVNERQIVVPQMFGDGRHERNCA